MGQTVFWPNIDPITTDFDGNRGDRFPPMRPRFCSGSRGPGGPNIFFFSGGGSGARGPGSGALGPGSGRGPQGGGIKKFLFEFWPCWPPRAPGPTTTPRAHRGEPIPPIPVEIRCNRTDFGPKNGLAHVCSSLPRTTVRSGQLLTGPSCLNRRNPGYHGI